MKMSITLDIDSSQLSNLQQFLEKLDSAKGTERVLEPLKVAKDYEKAIKSGGSEKEKIVEKTEQVKEKAQGITIDAVREMLSTKVADHKSVIKEKLSDLGAPNVTKLDPAKFPEFLNFLESL